MYEEFIEYLKKKREHYSKISFPIIEKDYADCIEAIETLNRKIEENSHDGTSTEST